MRKSQWPRKAERPGPRCGAISWCPQLGEGRRRACRVSYASCTVAFFDQRRERAKALFTRFASLPETQRYVAPWECKMHNVRETEYTRGLPLLSTVHTNPKR